MRFSLLKIILPVLTALLSQAYSSGQDLPDREQTGHALPCFSENKGQWDVPVLFRMKFNSGVLFLEKNRLSFSFVDYAGLGDVAHSAVPLANGRMGKGHAYHVYFEGCNAQATARGTDRYAHYENYYKGDDASRWASQVNVFRGARYEQIYHGIDLQFEGSGGHLKYSFFVQPKASPADINMRFDGVENIYLKDNVLHYTTSVNEIREEGLFAFQRISGKNVPVPCVFKLRDNVVSFEFPQGYDSEYELVIDPTLVFSTYTGSTADNFGFTATYDNTGHLYAGGIVFDFGYPITTGAYDVTFNSGAIDVSITKFNPAGTGLIYSTYLGGVESENPSSLVVNDQNELIVMGITSSPDFPTTTGAYDRTFNYGVGKTYPNNGPYFVSGTDIFVCKFNAAGSQLIGSTFIGGSGNDGLNDNDLPGQYGALVYNYGDQFRGEVVLDATGNIYVASSTLSNNFPTTTGAFQAAHGGGQDAVVFKFNGNLTSLIWSSYLGGSGTDAGYNLKVDNQSRVYVSGGTTGNFPTTAGSLYPTYRGGRADGFIAQISAAGNTILNATYIGTSAYDQSYFIERDGSGTVYVVGQTEGAFPVSPGVYSNPNSGQFLAALNSNLSAFIFSTVFGRGDNDPDISPTAFLVDNCRNIYISGWAGRRLMQNVGSNFNSTTSGLPITADAFQTGTDGSDFYFMVLSKDAASLTYGTYFGSPLAEDHVDGGTSRFDKNGVIYQAVCAGCGGFDDFPTSPGAWSRDNLSFNCNEGLIKFEFQLIGVNVSVSANSITGCVPLTVNFASNAINAKEFFWDFGNGNTSTLANPTHTFTSVGNYQVMLIGIDSTTCDNLVFSDTSFIFITVRDDSTSANFIPQVLSNCVSFIVQFGNSSINATSYLWNFGDGATSTLPSPTHQYALPGTYNVSLIVTNNSSCNIRDTLVTQVVFQPFIDAAIFIPDSFGCVPFTVDFMNSSDGGTQFFWDFGDGNTSTQENPQHTYSDTGIYAVRLVIVDPLSCNFSDTATSAVSVSDNRIITAFSLDTLAFNCDSLSVQLTNLSVNYTALLWDFGDGTTSTLENPIHTYFSNDTFTIRLITSNPLACNESDTSARVIFLPLPVLADFDAPDGCAPHDAALTNNSANAITYSWNFWDGSTAATPAPFFTNLASGSYSLTLTAYNPAACNDSSVATGSFTVYDGPVAFFITDKNEYEVFEDVLFTNQSTGGSVFFWDFDDNSTSSLENPIHAYGDTGAYFPCLTVSDQFGCDSSYCAKFEVGFIGVVDVPNAFSPNGDGANDFLFVRGVGVKEIDFRIYNRWGELVFDTRDAAIVCNALPDCIAVKGWDGTYKGVPQEMDVYVYTMSVLFHNGKKTGVRKGNITLVR